MATASLAIDTERLAAIVAAKLLHDNDMVMVSRKDIEHVALSMPDCFSDAEAATLNRLRAAIGYGPVTKTGHGAGRGWTPK
ncbi:hypothetical protein OG874_00465 [Nocardia sp. NBC_00565]|uniref:hypothetical protein n=1 Tax=Nocardia sp. NBC_00565 TaxID=2975993 RepID=UPI002E81EBD3|nr:hypothetical protein [Nocardia sp. NBC_00565]WUC03728.1 hypothetical protein OG874_00465 [Nocardia sp. NBC_00565]